jgi:hypothetical protein
MSSDDDEDVTGDLAWLNFLNIQNQVSRQFWVHPYWQANSTNMAPTKYLKN